MDGRPARAVGHVFLSYVRDDSEQVDGLQAVLESAGIRVWRDTQDLWPGDEWMARIRAAIKDDALVFIACFSSRSIARRKSVQNEELTVAVEEYRLRQPGATWLIPVRLDECELPAFDLGAGRTLGSLQYVDLFGPAAIPSMARLISTVVRTLNRTSEDARSSLAPNTPWSDAAEADELNHEDATDSAVDGDDEASAFTSLWRHTANGGEASSVMRIASTSMPGESASIDPKPAFVRVGICIPSEPIPADASSSDIGARLVEFLGREPVSDLIADVCDPSPSHSWRRLAGNGVLRLDAILLTDESNATPIASAMFLPPEVGLAQYGRVDALASLWLHLELPRIGDRVSPLGLARWYELTLGALSMASAFETFLVADIKVATNDGRPVQVAVDVEVPGSSVETIVDVGKIRQLPGGFGSSQFLTSALSDRQGQTAKDTARSMVRQLCDHTLHLVEFEPTIQAF